MIRHGCLLDVLKEYPDNHFDSVVTDPPYGLKFMAKKWDYDVPSVEMWREVLRVLKPGGHALIACGTRTQHRMAVNIEDAGFEVRDVITWLYGSGFPKSLSVSKAIDKEAGAEREVVGRYISPEGTTGMLSKDDGFGFGMGDMTRRLITAPATEAAKQWDGWGTALKPSVEYWTLCRKPLDECGKLIYEVHKCGVSLCQSLSNVLPVNEAFQSNLRECAEALNTAQWSAEGAINTLADLSEAMVMLQSELGTTSNWNTVLLWQRTLAEVLNNASTFTTEMASSLTIDLKTLNSCLSKSTQESTILDETELNGVASSVSNAESVLKSVLIKLSCIQNTSAQESVSPLSIKPACEFWTLARKPLSESTLAKNVLKHGTGGLNIDKSRIPASNPAWEEENTLCDSCARLAENHLKHIQPQTRELSVPSSVDTQSCEKALQNPVDISSVDTGCSVGMRAACTSISLSTDGSGNAHMELCQTDTSSTTLMKIRPTTDLKTCSSCGAQITSRIMQDEQIYTQKSQPHPTTYAAGKSETPDIEKLTQSEKLSAAPQGRWPSNLILSHSVFCTDTACEPDCPVKLLDEQSAPIKTKLPFRKLSEGETGMFSAGIGNKGQKFESTKGLGITISGASRFFYCAKASKSDRYSGLEAFPRVKCGTMEDDNYPIKTGSGNLRDTRRANHHPTVKPTKLMEYLCKLVTPPGGTILDPFAGSGSTGVAAKRCGFEFVGIEREEQYCEIAKARLGA